MLDKDVASDATLLTVPPKALKRYAESIGWEERNPFGTGLIAFSHPKEGSRQLILPRTNNFDDYADVVRTAIQRLADFEQRPVVEVLNHLLLPPADILRFSEKSVDAEGGSLRLVHAIDVLEGTYRMLLAQAHSELNPLRVHPRLSRSEAETFAKSCRLGQTERGSFTVAIACPLPTPSGLLTFVDGHFSRLVTVGIVRAIHSFARVAERGGFGELEDNEQFPTLSANFCEAFLMLRPEALSRHDYLTFGVTWSKAYPPPERAPQSTIRLDSECFEVAEHLALSLRRNSETEVGTFVGYVYSMKGETNDNGTVSGEVVLALMQMDDRGAVLAKAELDPEQYQVAGTAHLKGAPIACNGVLLRGPRMGRLTDIDELFEIHKP